MKISNDAQTVIVKKAGDDFSFFVIKRFDKDKQEDHYRLIKGGIKKNENSKETIIREVAEEAGINDVQKIEFFCRYGYTAGDVRHEVDVFLIYVDQNLDAKIDSSEEGGFIIKDAIWMNSEEAIEKLNFKEEKNLIIAAIEKLKFSIK